MRNTLLILLVTTLVWLLGTPDMGTLIGLGGPTLLVCAYAGLFDDCKSSYLSMTAMSSILATAVVVVAVGDVAPAPAITVPICLSAVIGILAILLTSALAVVAVGNLFGDRSCAQIVSNYEASA